MQSLNWPQQRAATTDGTRFSTGPKMPQDPPPFFKHVDNMIDFHKCLVGCIEERLKQEEEAKEDEKKQKESQVEKSSAGDAAKVPPEKLTHFQSETSNHIAKSQSNFSQQQLPVSRQTNGPLSECLMELM